MIKQGNTQEAQAKHPARSWSGGKRPSPGQAWLLRQSHAFCVTHLSFPPFTWYQVSQHQHWTPEPGPEKLWFLISVLMLHFPCALWQPESNLQSEGWGLGVRDKGQVSKAQLPFLSSACLECIYFFTLERNPAPPLVLYSPLPWPSPSVKGGTRLLGQSFSKWVPLSETSTSLVNLLEEQIQEPYARSTDSDTGG